MLECWPLCNQRTSPGVNPTSTYGASDIRVQIMPVYSDFELRYTYAAGLEEGELHRSQMEEEEATRMLSVVLLRACIG